MEQHGGMKLTSQLLKDIESNPNSMLEKLKLTEIASIIRAARKAYYNTGAALLSDTAYDILNDFMYKSQPGNALFSKDGVGAVENGKTVELPVWMPSLNKIKDDYDAVEKWRAAHKADDYIVSDKLDGVSALLEIDLQTDKPRLRMFTRGNGKKGRDISKIIKYFRSDVLPEFTKAKASAPYFLVRGELIIATSNWNQLLQQKDEGSIHNPRNTVAGMLKRIVPVDIPMLDFVAYELIEPSRVKPSQGLRMLADIGFKTVHRVKLSHASLTLDKLSTILKERRDPSHNVYQADGIVITRNSVENNNEYPSEPNNPSYAFAFKSILTQESAEVVVSAVDWNISRHGLLKPVVIFPTVYLSGAHIQRATGFNAKFIHSHMVGPGSRIVVIRSGDVIPYIKEVVAPAGAGEASMPDPVLLPWKWSGMEVVLTNPSQSAEYHLRQLEHFIKVFGIKGVRHNALVTMYRNGIDSIKKFINVSKPELYRAIRSAGPTVKVWNQIQNAANKGNCIEFMVASNFFGYGVGKRKLLKIGDAFPQIYNGVLPPLHELIATKGVGERSARDFMARHTDFMDFMQEVGLPCRAVNNSLVQEYDGMNLRGKNIVFTGFRSKELEEYITKRGGSVGSNVGRKTHYLIARDKEDVGIKMELALENDVTIMSLKDFKEATGFEDKGEANINQGYEDDERAFDELEKQLEAEGDAEEQVDDDDLLEPSELLTTKSECLRHVYNWSSMKKTHVFGKTGFRAQEVSNVIESASPKLAALLAKIQYLDKRDMTKHGKVFKHMIFTDVVKRGYGAKIIAAGLTTSGFNHAYNGNFVLSEKKLLETAGNNFAMLSKTQVYTKPMTVGFKLKLLQTINSRPSNVYGDLIRIVLIDGGYKEGIDLFDIKYVHIFEPTLIQADQQQAIGRATRFCGQRGLPFVDGLGWKLHVYKYDYTLGGDGSVKHSIDHILEHSKVDITKLRLAEELETICARAAVDKSLNKHIHSIGTGTGVGGARGVIETLPETRKGVSRLVKRVFDKFRWEPAAVNNLCTAASMESQSGLLQYTPSQAFIREYFQPETPLKGMFLWHSVGAGKTCTALACASYAWEASGYSILWVTRSTLRADVYKNMFEPSCVESVREYLSKGRKIPKDAGLRRRLISRQWMPPISYKQLQNVLTRSNPMYVHLVKRNGLADPFRKTLFIIDEAHLMLSSTMKAADRPDVELLHKTLQHSYNVSGGESARVILMSATPISDDPMKFMKLLNLTAQSRNEQLPESYDQFSAKFLPKAHAFTADSKEQFMDVVRGRISYLNRTKDLRQFAIPTFHEVMVPLSESASADMLQLQEQIDEKKQELEQLENGASKEAKVARMEKLLAHRDSVVAECEKIDNKKLKAECKRAAKEAYKEATDALKEELAEAKEHFAAKKSDLKDDIRILKSELTNAKRNDISVETMVEKCLKTPV